MLQRYEKYSKPPNFSAIFSMKIYKYFCIDNNPSLLRDKGMLLRNKGMLLCDKGMLLQARHALIMTNDRWQFQNNAHHTTCPAVILSLLLSLYTIIIIYIIINKYNIYSINIQLLIRIIVSYYLTGALLINCHLSSVICHSSSCSLRKVINRANYVHGKNAKIPRHANISDISLPSWI